MSDINEILAKLPPEKLEKVREFAESLLPGNDAQPPGMSLSWAGALREYRDRFTSLELQKKALEWWGD